MFTIKTEGQIVGPGKGGAAEVKETQRLDRRWSALITLSGENRAL
jgi:hypothetical protein